MRAPVRDGAVRPHGESMMSIYSRRDTNKSHECHFVIQSISYAPLTLQSSDTDPIERASVAAGRFVETGQTYRVGGVSHLTVAPCCKPYLIGDNGFVLRWYASPRTLPALQPREAV